MMKKILVLLFLLTTCAGACTGAQPGMPPQEQSAESDRTQDETIPFLCKTVLLDAGHGFGDVGCSFWGGHVYEKDITPVLTQKIGRALQARGVNVLYTHDGSACPTKSQLDALAEDLRYDLDGFLRGLIERYSGRTDEELQATLDTFYGGINENDLFGVYERCYYANLLAQQQEISLFVSVHVNANESCDTLTGFELFCCMDTPHADASGDAMLELQGALAYRFLQKETRIRAYGWNDAYVVTKYTDMPSVLIESGYATTPSDARELQDETWQNEFANAVADGIVRYLTTE
ncbi:MAG: N-acetylmuramoyl-L-alanine amidase [Clostridia bacterium]|nr:N-acetylmuramoyl-L-alanine amidase [Clostridia bacterium]